MRSRQWQPEEGGVDMIKPTRLPAGWFNVNATQSASAFRVASALSQKAAAEIHSALDQLLETGASFAEAKSALTRLLDRLQTEAGQGAGS